jgi:hypothetical protein
LLAILATAASAQTPAANQQTSECTFADGGQLSVRYEPAPAHGDRPPEGRVWSAGESPMYLFTTTTLKAGDTQIPVGAYSLYVVPLKNHWTLVVNKDVTSKKYDPQQDIASIPMDLGSLDQAEKSVQLLFAHDAPKQCSLRLYYGKTGAWAVFSEP